MKQNKKSVFEDLEKKMSEVDRQIDSLSNFEIEIQKLKGVDERKKILWQQIYRNAVDDRSSASMLFTEAYGTMGKSATDHVAMGGVLVKYLEKMSKSNQQLIDLSLLMSKDEEQSVSMDPDDLFREIEAGNE
jgi:predicted AAA+ superfamily ATPase